MARRVAKERSIKPIFYVFCEGKTEEEYVNFLRVKYRIPIKIRSKVTGHSISQQVVNSNIDAKEKHEKDKVFLMYDLDEEGLLEKLQQISDSILITSNPCIELWFLLHFRNQTAHITCDVCNRELKQKISGYEKGKLNQRLKNKLTEKYKEAIERGKELTEFNNPSSLVYKFIEKIEAKQ